MGTPMAAQTAPEHVRRIAPYVPGKPVEEVARELGLDPARIVKLASNENPRGPGPAVREAVAAAIADLPRYPDGSGYALKQVLARSLGTLPERLVLGNGSNDVLELVSLAFLGPGDEAVYAQHAFAVYPLATLARGARGVEVAARDFGHDLEAMRAALTPRTRVVFLANPNNPTGTWLPPASIRKFVEGVPASVIVVLDEAYHEYLEDAERSDAVSWVADHTNLVVSRTFSKAHGLAALRVGYGVMHESLADILNRVRQPFNVNTLAQVAAIAAVADAGYVVSSRELNRSGRARLMEGFGVLGLRAIPSHGNFVLVEVGDAGRVNAGLLREGVIVRPVGNYGLPGWLRITVGLPDENERCLQALATVLAMHGVNLR